MLLNLSAELDRIGQVGLADELRVAAATIILEAADDTINTCKTAGVTLGGLTGLMLGGMAWVPLTIVGYAGGRWIGRRMASRIKEDHLNDDLHPK
mgnify:CR=1 FL=1